MTFDGVIFDFDGTIADTSAGVLGSVRYAVEAMGRKVPNDDVLRGFIGPSLYSSFTKICGMNDGEAKEAIELYRSVYNPKGVYDCVLYDGMLELLGRLKADGVKLSVASSKPLNALGKVVDYLGLTRFFDKVAGADPSVKDDDKAALIASARLTKNSVMVGDSRFDIEGAATAGVRSVAVGYGFTDGEVLKGFNPDYYAADVAALSEILR